MFSFYIIFMIIVATSAQHFDEVMGTSANELLEG